MSQEDKKHWEIRYSDEGYEPNRHPSALLTGWLDVCPPGSALDLACGAGRNALYLAERGYDVTAIDISPRAIALAEEAAREKGLKIDWVVADLDHDAIQGQYDLIVISFFYLHGNLIPPIMNALKKGGCLLYENNMLSPSATDEEARKHRFHLKSGELRQLFEGLTVIHYEENPTTLVASLVAQKMHG